MKKRSNQLGLFATKKMSEKMENVRKNKKKKIRNSSADDDI